MDALRENWEGLFWESTEVLPEEQARQLCVKSIRHLCNRLRCLGLARWRGDLLWQAGLDRPPEKRAGPGSLEVTVVQEVSQLLHSPRVAQTVAAWQKAFFKEQKRFTHRSASVRTAVEGNRAFHLCEQHLA